MLFTSEFWAITLAQFADGVVRVIPFVAPVALVVALFYVWVQYKRMEYLASRSYCLLEVKVPREVTKSPLAMELVLNALHRSTGEDTAFDRYVKGKLRNWFSLELVSIEGDIHFFIWMDAFNKELVMNQIYSQYSSAEVYEVPDYTTYLPFGQEGSDWDLWGCEFKLSKKDAYPIRTYVDYGLDKVSSRDEAEKVDPITPVLEYLGSMGPGEQAWIQILVRANKGKEDRSVLFAPRRDWKEDAQAEVDELLQREPGTRKPKSEDVQQTEGFVMRSMPTLTEHERDVATAIQRSIGKLGFDAGVRGIYFGRAGYKKNVNNAGMAATMKQYGSANLNGFSSTYITDTNYPWDPYIGVRGTGTSLISLKGERITQMKLKIFDAYRRRSWFWPPYQREPYVLNTEELATIFHFPGGVAETPTFGRISSRKAEPPSNLPT